MRTTSRGLLIATLVIVFLSAHAARALAAQAKPLVKVVAGYGSTDGPVAALWFSKETKLCASHGLDVGLVGIATGSLTVLARRAKDPELASLSASGALEAALEQTDTAVISG